jgi:transcription-repair coupling factor (superfamily II helicase)
VRRCGYGKTEVAMRAAFKAAMDAKGRYSPRPPSGVSARQDAEGSLRGVSVRIDMLSRFRSKAEQKALDDLAAGKVEIIVSTHRLLSIVQFRDLGLLIVDEEQRFDVAHKERIKQMRKRSTLTMTATPIPRTLNMSLASVATCRSSRRRRAIAISIQTNVVVRLGGHRARDP